MAGKLTVHPPPHTPSAFLTYFKVDCRQVLVAAQPVGVGVTLCAAGQGHRPTVGQTRRAPSHGAAIARPQAQGGMREVVVTAGVVGEVGDRVRDGLVSRRWLAGPAPSTDKSGAATGRAKAHRSSWSLTTQSSSSS